MIEFKDCYIVMFLSLLAEYVHTFERLQYYHAIAASMYNHDMPKLYILL